MIEYINMVDYYKKNVRVRLAPSPSGNLHFGTVRTGLFNWLFARNQGGKFILRIEDTDIERSSQKYEENIINGLKWLGLNWDEGPTPPKDGEIRNYLGDYGPYRQSERLDIYEKYLRRLLDEKKAYYCFCSKEQLELDRQAMLAQGLAPKYSGRCSRFSEKENAKKLANAEPAVIRFRMPATEIEFNDLIRGKIKSDVSLIGDVVLARNLRSPLFIFSNAVDDYEMKITHVIRGEDHISNTPKQILIQKALGFDEIKYAHLPLILAPNKTKLSKRFLETNLDDYKKQGYLSEAILNFLALIGWHPKDEREILSVEELIKEFDLKRVQKAGAIFNVEKLDWLNNQYIKKTEQADLINKLKDFVPAEWLSDKNKKLFAKAVAVEKERMKKLTDFKELARFFFELPEYKDDLLIWPRPKPAEKINKEKTFNNLKLLLEEINKIFKVDFNTRNLEKTIIPLSEVWGRGELLWPLRAALSGKEASPGPFEIMEAIGKEEIIRRLKIAIEKLAP
ncbi:glutamate--tRNA ligase [Candidatus Wolfebacteria bacterium CG03_land_8_20_14_0_80_40_12]|uniref:Glutamate--tRNA ligase n=1 Tax=Candidatus Wolfebacteria bacterium CG03_land_8_20_14_0_80_40_12 TaxID=1975069 RepID=A0A2M7B5U4_9BACT|nr:MAG: glutamate--tRNA ligase [Candidatus Wolfebacteria bacterium CG03_land_8_20_14_0_80_40_12]